MSSDSRTLQYEVSGAPVWWTALADNTWTRIARGSGSDYASGARMDQVTPTPLPAGTSPAPYYSVWTGACVDQTRGEMLITGGGHGAYQGNEIYALNLRAATPAWRRINEPSPGVYTGGGGEKNGAGQYTADIGVNGAPQAGHNSRLIFANDTLWLPGIWAMQISNAGDTQGCSRPFSFPRKENKWRRHEAILDSSRTSHYSVGFMQGAPAVFVPSTNLIWSGFVAVGALAPSDSPIVYAIDATTGQLQQRYTTSQWCGFAPAAWACSIPNTTLVAIATGWDDGMYYGGSGLYIWDTANPVAAFRPPKVAVTDSTGGVNWKSEVHGVMWHAASGALLVYPSNGENIIKIKPDSANNFTGAWTATVVTPSNSANPSRVVPDNYDPNGYYIYGRANLIEDMGDGRSALVVQPSQCNTCTYVYKLPLGEV